MTAPKAPAAKKAAAPAAPPAGARRADTAPKSTKGPGRPTNKAKRAERAAQLADQLTTLSLGLTLISPDDAVAVGRHAENVAGALADLADQNRLVARLLDGAATGGVMLGVFTAVVPLAAELLANHGALGALSPLFNTRARMTAEAAAATTAAGEAGKAVVDQLAALVNLTGNGAETA